MECLPLSLSLPIVSFYLTPLLIRLPGNPCLNWQLQFSFANALDPSSKNRPRIVAVKPVKTKGFIVLPCEHITIIPGIKSGVKAYFVLAAQIPNTPIKPNPSKALGSGIFSVSLCATSYQLCFS